MDQEGREAVSFALQQLANADWRIRAAAADGLLSFGKSGVRAAFTLLPRASEPVRIGIARMVINLADEDLLDEFVRYCSRPDQTVGTHAPNGRSQSGPESGPS
jgi:HEAT repeat protein